MTAIVTPVEDQTAFELPLLEIPCDLEVCRGPARWTVTWAPAFHCPTCGHPPAFMCDWHKRWLLEEMHRWLARCPCGYFKAPMRTVLKRVDPL